LIIIKSGNRFYLGHGKTTNRRSTVVLRVPKRFQKKILDYVDYLKASEASLAASQVRAEAAGLIELHEIACAYGINRVDQEGRLLDKEKLRPIVIEFFRAYTS
jgi:hypothetical protein